MKKNKMTDRLSRLNCCLTRYILKHEHLSREEYKIRILSTQIIAILIAHLEQCTFRRSLERIIKQFNGILANGADQIQQINDIRKIIRIVSRRFPCAFR